MAGYSETVEPAGPSVPLYSAMVAPLRFTTANTGRLSRMALKSRALMVPVRVRLVIAVGNELDVPICNDGLVIVVNKVQF